MRRLIAALTELAIARLDGDGKLALSQLAAAKHADAAVVLGAVV
jgi:hypothetical protein